VWALCDDQIRVCMDHDKGPICNIILCGVFYVSVESSLYPAMGGPTMPVGGAGPKY
jgi:hypothetical protein